MRFGGERGRRSAGTGTIGGRIRALAALALLVATAAADLSCARIFPRQYEYEEEIYLSLDGSATLYVNSSVPALVALRGLALDFNPRARLDRDAVASAYKSDVADVVRVTTSRRSGRRFVHIRLAVRDVRRLGEVAPLAWSTYSFKREGNAFVYRQVVGAPAGRQVGDVGWKGNEAVAFRLHLPSKIQYHNAPSKQVERGNILTWEQPLTSRLAGTPIVLDVRMDDRSILNRTLWLFGLMIVLVAVLFVALIWWIVRAGRDHGAGREGTGST
jgi:hypothetical protein